MANQGKYNDIVDTGFDLHLLLMERFKNRLHSEYIMYYAYALFMSLRGFPFRFFFCILYINDPLKIH